MIQGTEYKPVYEEILQATKWEKSFMVHWV